MSWQVPIRRLLDMRHQYGDQKVLDLLELSASGPEGVISTNDLMTRWKVTQPNVSRRIANLQGAGLVDISSAHGFYRIHWSILR